MNKKVFATVLILLTTLILVAPLAAAVNAKPTIATVNFHLETWPNRADIIAGNYKMFTNGAGKTIILGLNIVGIPKLVNDEYLLNDVPEFPADWITAWGGVRLIIQEGANDYTLIGKTEQTLLHSVDGDKGFSVEKWSFMVLSATENAPDDAVGSTLDLLAYMRGQEGRCVGAGGTGIFKKAQMKGTFSVTLSVFGQGILFKVQEGLGELKFS